MAPFKPKKPLSEAERQAKIQAEITRIKMPWKGQTFGLVLGLSLIELSFGKMVNLEFTKEVFTS